MAADESYCISPYTAKEAYACVHFRSRIKLSHLEREKSSRTTTLISFSLSELSIHHSLVNECMSNKGEATHCGAIV